MRSVEVVSQGVHISRDSGPGIPYLTFFSFGAWLICCHVKSLQYMLVVVVAHQAMDFENSDKQYPYKYIQFTHVRQFTKV